MPSAKRCFPTPQNASSSRSSAGKLWLLPTTKRPTADFHGTSRDGRCSIKKRPIGGSCEKRLNPSRSSVPEFKTSWPRPIPAKTLLLLGYRFDAEHATRDSKARLATLALDGLSFISLGRAERKGMLTN